MLINETNIKYERLENSFSFVSYSETAFKVQKIAYDQGKLSKSKLHVRGVFRTQSNIYD